MGVADEAGDYEMNLLSDIYQTVLKVTLLCMSKAEPAKPTKQTNSMVMVPISNYLIMNITTIFTSLFSSGFFFFFFFFGFFFPPFFF